MPKMWQLELSRPEVLQHAEVPNHEANPWGWQPYGAVDLP